MTAGKLSDVCCQRNADPIRQKKAIERLLKAGADIQETDKNGVTPLHHAVRFRSPTAVETLLSHGAAVNQACKRSGSTPLHRAVTTTGAPSTAGKNSEARRIIELLLQYGADPSLQNKVGRTAVDYVRDEELRRMLTKRRRMARRMDK
jgi:ankyrin repeat protein